MKILIIRFSSIGDIVLTTPIVRCVKQQLPHAEIHYLTKRSFQPVVENNPYIDKCIYLESGDLQPLVLQLLKEQYDVVIDLHRNLRTRYIQHLLKQAYNSKVSCFTFPKLNGRKWLYTNLKINWMPDISIVERYFLAVKELGVTNDGKGLDYFIAASDEIQKDDLPTSHALGFVALSIGGQHATKKMPEAKWQQFCKQFDFPMVLMGGKEDAEAAEQIASVDPIKIYNACGKFSLNESAHILQQARFVISHDTGLMHIAAAFKKPIISIWGNTVPAFGMFPYYGYNNLKSRVAPNLYILENKKLYCRPCSKIGYKKCPKKHFNCMNKLEMAELIAMANSLRNNRS